jgi:mycoredoxin-dependent peroxiredoxin
MTLTPASGAPADAAAPVGGGGRVVVGGAPGGGGALAPVGAAAVPVGAAAPGFALKDQNNQVVSLSDFRGKRAVLLVFYPFAFSGICQSELGRVRDHLADFQNDGVQVLAVSVDTVYANKVWAERERYEFPLLSDFWPHGAVALAYGVFNDRTGAANRGTFVVDRHGVVTFAAVNAPGEPRDQQVWRAALADL